MNYKETILKYPFAKYVKYLAGDDLTEEQIVSIFNGEKVRCTVNFAYPSKKKEAEADVYGRVPYGGIRIYDLNVWANKDRTDLYIEYSDSTLMKILPKENDPVRIGRRKILIVCVLILLASVIVALGLFKGA